jgi:hypothetical protein
MIAHIGQQQWSCTFFRLSDRTLISRARSWFDRNQWNSRRKPDFWLPRGFEPFLGMAGRCKQLVQYGGDSAHKSWAPGDHSSLGDYVRDSSHQRGTESAHQRDQGEVSSWRFRRAKRMKECSTAGGFPSNPILSGSAPDTHNSMVAQPPSKKYLNNFTLTCTLCFTQQWTFPLLKPMLRIRIRIWIHIFLVPPGSGSRSISQRSAVEEKLE